MTTLRQALMARLPRRGDDRGSLPLLMLVMLVSTAFGGIMMASVITQAHTSRFDQTRVHALHAAQSGVDLLVGKIRAAVTAGTTTGDDAKLPPCTPVTGAADNQGRATFTASVTYYTANPATAGSQPMLCSVSGPYDPTAATRTPSYAVVSSTGHDGTTANGGSSGRTLQSTYVFQTNDVNFTGGEIRIYPSGPDQWCMDAGSSPSSGTAVLLQACSTSTPPSDQQVWSYRSDLSIELTSSATTTSTGLCIDTSPTAHAAGDTVVLAPCAVPDASVCAPGTTSGGCRVSPYDQQWSVDDAAHLRGARVDQSDTDTYCLNVGSQAADVALTLSSCAGTTTDTAQTWVPSPTTGAGMASAGNSQLVNYKQFATCLDVTGQQVDATFLILYTCKQNPNPAKVRWNQKFGGLPAPDAAPTQVLLTVTTDAGVKYCLQSPPGAGAFPALSASCPTSVAAAAGTGFLWTINQKYATSAKTTELSYTDKYTIVDFYGFCLTPGQNSDLYIGQYYKAIVADCDGSTSQKWNADPSLGAATIVNTHEIYPTGG